MTEKIKMNVFMAYSPRMPKVGYLNPNQDRLRSGEIM